MLDSAQSAAPQATLCERFHKHGIRASLILLLALAWPIAATAQAPVEPAPPAHGAQAEHAPSAEHREEHHEESPLAFAARIGNFLILAGGLYYFLRKPLGQHLIDRRQQITSDLVTAKETSATAATQIADIDRKLQALPGELAALKARGAEEIANEEARIRQSADAERQRLIEQTRREIDLQVRLAKRELTEQAAALAVELASTQIKQTITPDDQQRLIDRYVAQVRQAHD